MQPKLGILAGRGVLPERLIEAMTKVGRPFLIIAFKGQTPEDLVVGRPHAWVRLGAAGTAIDILRREGCEELVMAGGIRRPSLANLLPDAWTTAFFARHGMAAFGDDGLLSALIDDLETKEGFRVVKLDEVLPDVIVTEGCLTSKKPNDAEWQDIHRGFRVAKALGNLDVGQGCIVAGGLVLAVEAIEGTEAMIQRVGSSGHAKQGGVLVKVPKPDQEARADMPTIGPDTIAQAETAGLSGIAVEAHGSIVLDRDVTVNAANQANLFVIGVRPGTIPE